MNLPPDDAEAVRKRMLELYRRGRAQRLDDLEADVRKWMSEGNALLQRIFDAKGNDDTTIVIKNANAQGARWLE